MAARKNQKKMIKQAKAALALKQARATKRLTSAATATLPFAPRWFDGFQFIASIVLSMSVLLSMLSMLMFRSDRLDRAARAIEFLEGGEELYPVSVWAALRLSTIRPRRRGRHW